MTWHDARTSGTSRVFTVASLQRLKVESLIPAPADCEVLSVMKFLNAQIIAPIEIHRQLCQVYVPNGMSKQMCVAGADNLQQVDTMCLRRLWENALWRIITTQFRDSAVILCRFPTHCCTKFSWSTFCSENCAPGGLPKQLTPEHKAKRMESALTFLQGYHDDSKSFSIGSSQVMKRGLHTLPQKPRSSSTVPSSNIVTHLFWGMEL